MVCKDCIHYSVCGFTYIANTRVEKDCKQFSSSTRLYGKWWLRSDGSGTCNICRYTQKNVWDDDHWQNYCGHCGAKMISVE